MNKFEKKNSGGSLFGLFMAVLKVAQNINATVGQPQGAPGFGVDFFMNRKLRQPSSSPSMNDYGLMGRYETQF